MSDAVMTVDALAQEIRRVDGSNSLGAGALAEALMPFLAASTPVGGWEDKEAEPRINEIGHLWLASDDRGRVFPSVLVGHRIPEDAVKVMLIPLPNAAPPPPSVSTGSRPQEAVPTEQADGSVLVPIGWMQGVWNMGSDALKRLPRDPQGALVSLTGAMMALHAVMPTQPIPQPAEGCSSNEGAGQ